MFFLIETCPVTGANQHVVFNALDSGQVRTYQMPVSLLDNDANGNETSGTF